MKYMICKKIGNINRMNLTKLQDMVMSERVRHLIESKEILYNEELGVHFVLCDCYRSENFAEECLELVIIIDILDDIDKDIQKSLDTLKHSLGELLPTKRAEKFGARK